MDEHLDRVRTLKAAAKSARDDQKWEEAISYLQDAITILKTRVPDASSPRPTWLASQLADTYGLMGGIERRWGLMLESQERQRHLEASLAAYNAGFAYEKGLQPSEENTYNRVNRLVGRVLLDPGVLEKDGTAFPGSRVSSKKPRRSSTNRSNLYGRKTRGPTATSAPYDFSSGSRMHCAPLRT